MNKPNKNLNNQKITPLASYIAILIILIIFSISVKPVFEKTQPIISFCKDVYHNKEKYNLTDFFNAGGDESLLPIQCVEFIAIDDKDWGFKTYNYTEEFINCMNYNITPQQRKAQSCHWMGSDHISIIFLVGFCMLFLFAISIFASFIYNDIKIIRQVKKLNQK